MPDYYIGKSKIELSCSGPCWSQPIDLSKN
jgi:hypothetical protein